MVGSIIGSIKINNVSNSSNVQIGNAAYIVMSSNNKMSGGASSFSPGDSFGSLNNYPNNVTYEPNVGSRALNG
ncbi:spore germination protein [Paenibacillus chitinolyticus]|uniref:spore germination protein n=1 Tax=Paenibacillus chitinolyticus TaxID=79263 RepID=UPI002DBA7F9F|nr:spore germination protein [Paenibacillus chitinolyticus]MEC0249479.1 spore germination protein [Paenibacillus chitinolyticus]